MHLPSQAILLKFFGLAFSILALGACDQKEDNKENQGENQEPREEVAEIVGSELEQQKEEHQGHELGDPGHAPREAAPSPNRLFLASVNWSTPLVAGSLNNTAEVSFWGPDLHKKAAVIKSFKLFMPAMGHGSIKTDQMQFSQDPANAALWKVSKIYFSMPGGPGEWVVDIEAEVGGQTDKVRIAIPHEVGE